MKPLIRLFIISILLTWLLSACNVPKSLSPEEQQQTVQVIAQQTVQAIETQNALQKPTQPVPTNTLPPIDTPPIDTPVVLTDTLPPIDTPPIDTPLPPSETPTATPPSAPTLTPSLTPSVTSSVKCNHAGWVTDVSILDNTVLAPNAAFTKTWRLKNIGSCTWTTSYAVVFDNGDSAMGYTNPVFLTSSVAPNQTVDLSVNLKAPATTGPFTANFKLRDDKAVLFGLGSEANSPFWVKIIVAAPGTYKAFDFVTKVCDATWSSGAGSLPCPGTESDSKGFVVVLDKPKWENDVTDDEAALLTHPEWVDGGEIAGKYPAFRVLPGDRFKAVIGCRYGGTACNVKYYLNYQIGSGPESNFSSWSQKYDGTLKKIDIDLAPLANNDVKFILRVAANGSSGQDWALWLQPRIMR